MEARLLLAFVLMGLVLFLTPYFYRPAPPPPPDKSGKTPTTTEQTKKAPPPGQPVPPPAPVAAPVPGQIQADKEETLIIDTDLHRVSFSNRGAVVRSWILKAYKDGLGSPLELVNQEALAKVAAPFSLVFKGQPPATDPNQALFVTKAGPDKLAVEFAFSDGRTATKKSLHFRAKSYLVEVSTEVLESGVRLPHLITWRGGFGDSTVINPASVQHTLFYDLGQQKLNVKDVKEAKNGPVSSSGTYSFAGLEDNYFAGVFLPLANAQVELATYSDQAPTGPGKGDDARVGAGIGGDGLNRFQLFVGPKDDQILRSVDPKLEQVVDWGWFWFLAKPLFAVLNWTSDKLVHNYGWSIVLVTIAINMLLLPLKWTSLKSARKMQMLQPQIAAINEKYKNVGLRDPRRAEQNQEVMELYKKHGANPLGGCLPMLLQIPFFIAFYKVLTVAIEMRHASWLWVSDLSQPEALAIRLLPVTMIVTQFVLQKMTPTTGMDPTQQKVMLIMPLGLGYMFYYQSAGLVLYWLTGNLVGIVQQWFTNKLMPAPPVAAKPAPKRKKN